MCWMLLYPYMHIAITHAVYCYTCSILHMLDIETDNDMTAADVRPLLRHDLTCLDKHKFYLHCLYVEMYTSNDKYL